MCLSVGLEYILLGVQWAFMFRFMFFIKLGKVSAIISSNILSVQSSFSPLPSFFLPALLSGTPTKHILVCVMLSHKSLKLCSLFSIYYFSIPRLDNFHGPLFKFIGSFFCLLKSAFETHKWIFYFSYCTFQLQDPFIGFLPFIDISILFMYHFFDFLYLFSFLSIFKTVVSKSLSSISAIRSLSRTISDYFWTGHTFLFLVCLCSLLKTGNFNLIIL